MEVITTLALIAVVVFGFRQYQRRRDDELLGTYEALITAARQTERARGAEAEADRLLEIHEAVQNARSAVYAGRRGSLDDRTMRALLKATNIWDLERIFGNTGLNHLPVYAALMRLARRAA